MSNKDVRITVVSGKELIFGRWAELLLGPSATVEFEEGAAHQHGLHACELQLPEVGSVI